MDVKIADLPEGNDPADLVLKDKEGWKNVLRNAKPVVEFQIDKVMKEVKDKKLDNRKIPALIREDVLPFILAVQGAMERSGFVKMIKERTGISEEAINKDLGNFDKKKAYDTIPSNVRERLLDPILRKFGLLINIEREHSAIKRITGNERYNNLIKEVEPFKDALQLEAEVLFTNNSKGHVEELLLRLEEDIIREELSRIMEISDKKTLEEKYKNLNNRKKEIEDKLNNIKK